jgi:hypothetical protein
MKIISTPIFDTGITTSVDKFNTARTLALSSSSSLYNFQFAFTVDRSNVGSTKTAMELQYYLYIEGNPFLTFIVAIDTVTTSTWRYRLRVYNYKTSGFDYSSGYYTSNIDDWKFVRVIWTADISSPNVIAYQWFFESFDDEFMYTAEASGTSSSSWNKGSAIATNGLSLKVRQYLNYASLATGDRLVVLSGPHGLYPTDATYLFSPLAGFDFSTIIEELEIDSFGFPVNSYTVNQLYALDYRSEMGDLNTALSDADAKIDSLQSDLDDANDALIAAQADIDALVSGSSSVSGDIQTAANTAYAGAAPVDYFKTKMITPLSKVTDQFTGSVAPKTGDEYDPGITGVWAFMNEPLTILHDILAGLIATASNITTDLFIKLVAPLGDLIDQFINQAKSVFDTESTNFFNWLKSTFGVEVADNVHNFVNFIPTLFPSVAIAGTVVDFLIDWLDNGSFTDALINALSSELNNSVDNMLTILDTLIGVFTYFMDTIFDLLGVEVTYMDLTPYWNAFVTYMDQDDDNVVSLSLIGTGIGITTLPSSTFLVPTEFSSTYFDNLHIDTWDLVLGTWAIIRWKWFSIAVAGFGIPVPSGLSYWAIKDIHIPLAGYLNGVKTNPGHFSGYTDGFSGKDLCLDLFILDLSYHLVKWLGNHAAQALQYAIAGVQLGMTFLKPNLKDVIHRITDTDVYSLKFDDEEVTLWDRVVELETHLTTVEDKIDVINALILALPGKNPWI